MESESEPAPRRKSATGRTLLIAFIAGIAAAYYFLPEEGGKRPESSTAVFPGVRQNDQSSRSSNAGRVAIPASRPGAAQGVHLVEFWAEWCGPCKIQEPIISRVAQQYAGMMQVSKVDVDSNADLAQQFGVKGVPTIIIFKDGQEAARFVGVTDEGRLQQTIGGLTR